MRLGSSSAFCGNWILESRPGATLAWLEEDFDAANFSLDLILLNLLSRSSVSILWEVICMCKSVHGSKIDFLKFNYFQIIILSLPRSSNMNFFAAPPQSLAEEQKNLDNLKQYNPKLANSLLSKYMEMVVAAGAGEMETLQTLLLSAGRPPMTWFRVRMFQEGERVDKDAKREFAKW